MVVYCLIQNAVIAIFANDRAALDLLRANDECLLPSTVLGELYFGAAHFAKSWENRKRIDRFSSSIAVLPSDRLNRRFYDGNHSHIKNLFQADPTERFPNSFTRLAILSVRDPHAHAVQLDLGRWVLGLDLIAANQQP